MARRSNLMGGLLHEPPVLLGDALEPFEQAVELHRQVVHLVPRLPDRQPAVELVGSDSGDRAAELLDGREGAVGEEIAADQAQREHQGRASPSHRASAPLSS